MIEFENVLVASPNVHMWDEAFQVILDCQPAQVVVPYLKESAPQDQLYRLTLSDFLRGLVTTHRVVSSAVKGHPALNLLHYDQKRQLNWIITHVAGEAREMTIDSNFFTDDSKVKDCGGAVRVVDSLEGLL